MGTEKKGLWELKAAGKSRKQDYQKKKKCLYALFTAGKVSVLRQRIVRALNY